MRTNDSWNSSIGIIYSRYKEESSGLSEVLSGLFDVTFKEKTHGPYWYPDSFFDFILNEHVLEHLPDPLRALYEWRRVLKQGGILFMTLPHPERTFDRNREITPLAHLIADHDNGALPKEDFHWGDWKSNVLDAGLASHYRECSKEESLSQNLIHRHVFSPESVSDLLSHAGYEVIERVEKISDRFDSFGVVSRKPFHP